MFIVVADASVLIHLARIGRFHLLRTVYDQICIASSVFAEVVEKGWGLAGSIETERAVREGWIKVLDVVDKWKVREMAATHRIHLANAETVQLAREAKASVLLADEEEVRELAIEFGLEVRGCLGLLVEAARRELMSVKEAKKDAERLIEEGYRISEEVVNYPTLSHGASCFHDQTRSPPTQSAVSRRWKLSFKPRLERWVTEVLISTGVTSACPMPTKQNGEQKNISVTAFISSLSLGRGLPADRVKGVLHYVRVRGG